MAPSPVLLALPARMRARGVTVVEMPGWQTRDSGDGPFAPIGILDHHDAMGLHSDAVPRNMTKPQTDGAQLWIHSNGALYMLAAGRCWHAGSGSGYGDILAGSGNTLSVGIETDYSGSGPWPPALLATWRIVHHELAVLIGFSAKQVPRRLAGHKEYAPARKVDPGNLDMAVMRANLIADLSGAVNPTPTNPLPTGPGGAGGQDTNDMADITEAQMDRIAGKVVAQLLSGQAVFPVGDQVTTVAGALADLLRSRLAPKDVWTYGIPPGYDAQSLLYTAAGAPKPAEQPGK